MPSYIHPSMHLSVFIFSCSVFLSFFIFSYFLLYNGFKLTGVSPQAVCPSSQSSSISLCSFFPPLKDKTLPISPRFPFSPSLSFSIFSVSFFSFYLSFFLCNLVCSILSSFRQCQETACLAQLSYFILLLYTRAYVSHFVKEGRRLPRGLLLKHLRNKSLLLLLLCL